MEISSSIQLFCAQNGQLKCNKTFQMFNMKKLFKQNKKVQTNKYRIERHRITFSLKAPSVLLFISLLKLGEPFLINSNYKLSPSNPARLVNFHEFSIRPLSYRSVMELIFRCESKGNPRKKVKSTVSSLKLKSVSNL